MENLKQLIIFNFNEYIWRLEATYVTYFECDVGQVVNPNMMLSTHYSCLFVIYVST